jgi:hypothetical protein
MSHPEPEVLLGTVAGASDDETRRHVATCARCQGDLATMSRARSAGARLTADPELGTIARPPHGVWESIQRELADTPAPVASVPAPPRRPARRRSWVLVAASVAAGVVLGASVAAVVGRDADTSTDQATRTSSLDPLEGHATSGTLALTGSPPRESLSVQLNDPDPGSGFLEVWLLDAKTGGMVSLGVLDGDRGSYAVPSGLDLSAYDQVDVSREPFDGDPAHSTVSLARGQVP